MLAVGVIAAVVLLSALWFFVAWNNENRIEYELRPARNQVRAVLTQLSKSKFLTDEVLTTTPVGGSLRARHDGMSVGVDSSIERRFPRNASPWTEYKTRIFVDLSGLNEGFHASIGDNEDRSDVVIALMINDLPADPFTDDVRAAWKALFLKHNRPRMTLAITEEGLTLKHDETASFQFVREAIQALAMTRTSILAVMESAAAQQATDGEGYRSRGQ